MLKPDGCFDANGENPADTFRCIHCSAHVEVRPGFQSASTEGGFCESCFGVVCHRCLGPCEKASRHFMRAIEAAEARGRLLASILG